MPLLVRKALAIGGILVAFRLAIALYRHTLREGFTAVAVLAVLILGGVAFAAFRRRRAGRAGAELSNQRAEAIVAAFADCLGQHHADKSPLLSDTLLPFPKKLIREALEHQAKNGEDGEYRMECKKGIPFLNYFIPESLLPSDPKEAMRRYTEIMQKAREFEETS